MLVYIILHILILNYNQKLERNKWFYVSTPPRCIARLDDICICVYCMCMCVYILILNDDSMFRVKQIHIHNTTHKQNKTAELTCMCVCTCICIYMCIYMCMCMCMCMCMYVYVCTYLFWIMIACLGSNRSLSTIRPTSVMCV